MVTSEDAKALITDLHMLSAKHEVTDSDPYTQGQHDGRRDAYALSAQWVQQNNREEADGE